VKKIACLLVLLFFLSASWYISPVLAEETSTDDQQTEEQQEKEKKRKEAEEKEREEEKRIQELTKTINELQKKLSETQSEQQSLASVLGSINSQVLLNETEIEKTEREISLLERQVSTLDERIEGLELSLADLSKMLLSRVEQQYKQSQLDPVSSFFASTGITEYIKQQRYLLRVRQHTQDLLVTTEYKRQVYNDEKQVKQQKQQEVEALRAKLASKRAALQQQKAEKQRLLDITKNNEATYQRLLEEAQSELGSFRSFTSSQGGGVLPPQNSPDGWYFSQRDERWAGMCIGASCGTKNEGRMLEVGCLVSSVAMVKKKYGENVTPITIAANRSAFFSTTAYMLRPWPAPAGKRFVYSSYNQNTLDAELREGRPVIVHLRIGTNDGHFIVIKGGSKGDYVMHDPWEGYDKKFTDYYRVGQISTMALIR
jgi:peptidoglycan hydrolase CwlO-like protein